MILIFNQKERQRKYILPLNFNAHVYTLNTRHPRTGEINKAIGIRTSILNDIGIRYEWGELKSTTRANGCFILRIDCNIDMDRGLGGINRGY